MKALVVGDVIDDILVTPSTPIRTNTDTHASIKQSPGGSAANFACWLGSISKKTDTVHTDTVHTDTVQFVGRVNQEDLGRHQKVLEQFGVTPHLQADKDLATGSIVVIVEGQDRSFLTDRGANQNLDISAIPDQLFGDLIYVSGYSLLSISEKDIKTLISRAHNLGAKVAVDPGSAGFIQDFGIKRFLDAIKDVDILLPNLEEGRILTGEDRPEIITAMLNERFPLVALTMGSDGCAVRASPELASKEAFYLQLATPIAQSVDPTGAGDAFAAAFLNSYITTGNLEVAGKAGIRLGGIAVTLNGGRPPQSAS